MTYTIPSNCFDCGICMPKCPNDAIQKDKNHGYWIEPGLCNECEDQNSQPLCVASCPDSLPLPLPAKKGRYKSEPVDLSTNYLFANGENNPISSSIVTWEACNLLASGPLASWQTDEEGKLYFQRDVKQGKGKIVFRLIDDLLSDNPEALDATDGLEKIESLDIRAACIHLIFAASITALEKPWEEEFLIDNKQIEAYLGFEKRKDLSKATKLTLIKNIVLQACQLMVSIDWFQQGKIQSFSVPEDPVWHLVDIENHFQEDVHGYKYFVGMTFKIKAGIWSQYFLNKQGYKKFIAFYQYGILPKFLLTTVTTIRHQHTGAARIMLWLIFKSKMGRQQRITVPKLMNIAYGEAKVQEASLDSDKRKHMLKRFENDLEVLHSYQIKCVFDPITYPFKIQPLWSKLQDVPDDAEEAAEFWINDASKEHSITSTLKRGKWNLLMKARILQFELPPEWDKQLTKWENKKQKKTKYKKQPQNSLYISGEEIASSRKRLGISQRKLAEQIGKSQSWIRDIEKGRFSLKPSDSLKLVEVLEINPY